MLKHIIKFLSPSQSQVQVPLMGLLLATGFLVGEAKPVNSNQVQSLSSYQLAVRTEAFGRNTILTPRGKLPEVDGVYLYGQAPEPQQIGKEYMIFEIRQGKVIGAFYLPYSEFSCFSGTLQSGKLAMMVANTPDSEPYPDAIATQNSQQVAVTEQGAQAYNANAYPHSVALQEYYQIAAVGESDHNLLENCRNTYQK